MLIAEDTELVELERLLVNLKKTGFGHAARQMINSAAWKTREFAQDKIKDDFVNRNKWTAGSVRVIQAKSLDMDRMEARVGSIEDYMRKQEEGHTIFAKGKHGVPIPTGYSAGQKGSRPRTRLPRNANRMQNIRLARFLGRGKTPKQRALRAVQNAVKTGNRYIFIDFGLGNKKGIFKVLGGRRTFKRGWPINARIMMVQDLTQKTVQLRRHPWLGPSSEKAKAKYDEFYRKALLSQLRRFTPTKILRRS
jgi:hypothetical protein